MAFACLLGAIVVSGAIADEAPSRSERAAAVAHCAPIALSGTIDAHRECLARAIARPAVPAPARTTTTRTTGATSEQTPDTTLDAPLATPRTISPSAPSLDTARDGTTLLGRPGPSSVRDAARAAAAPSDRSDTRRLAPPVSGAATPSAVADPVVLPDDDGAVEDGDTTSRERTTNTDAKPLSDTDSPADTATDASLLQRLTASVQGLDATGRIALLAALLLPVLLLATRWASERGARRASVGPHGTRRNPSLAGRVRNSDVAEVLPADLAGLGPIERAASSPGARHTFDVRDRLDRQADDLFSALDETVALEEGELDLAPRRASTPPAAQSAVASDRGQPVDSNVETLSDIASERKVESVSTSRLGRDGMNDGPTGRADGEELDDIEALARPDVHDAPTVLIGTPHAPSPDSGSALSELAPANGQERGEASGLQHGATRSAIGPRSAFGQWLESQGDALRQQHAIEFLIYWIAYGDERYEPELKARLLGGEPADAHELIKRTVLERDIEAFADALRWVVANLSREQRRQTLELAVALLVVDAQPTPVQNTLLRFLADAFGLSQDGLTELWQHGFGLPLAPLARVDRADWWQGANVTELVARDPRLLADASPDDQARVRLGLPLEIALDPARVRAAHRLAVLRSEPGRFDALGPRERALAARQLARFEEARDILLDDRS